MPTSLAGSTRCYLRCSLHVPSFIQSPSCRPSPPNVPRPHPSIFTPSSYPEFWYPFRPPLQLPLPRPNNLAHSHTDRANTCRSSSRLNKRACSNSDHSVHGHSPWPLDGYPADRGPQFPLGLGTPPATATGQGALARSATGSEHLEQRSRARAGEGPLRSTFSQWHMLVHRATSPSLRGHRHRLGHVGSPISSNCKPCLGFSARFSRPCCHVVSVLYAAMVFFGCLLVGMVGCFLDRVAGRCGVLLKTPFSPLFSRRWSRHRRKRIRGSGSQAASRRGAKCRRLALAFKAPSESILARGTRWLRVFVLPSVHMFTARQRSALQLATCTTLFIASAMTCVGWCDDPNIACWWSHFWDRLCPWRRRLLFCS